MELTDTVGSVLKEKRQEVCSVEPDTSVYEALQKMAEKDIGALLVMSNDKLVGVISERDYARKVILLGKTSRETLVSEIMCPPDAIVGLDTTVSECMRMMTESRRRHLPVLDGSRVVGVLSIGDMVNHIISAQEENIRQLHAYVTGNYPA